MMRQNVLCFLWALLLWGMSGAFVACSDDDSGGRGSGSGFAPTDVAGREFRLYSNPPRWSVRMTPGTNPTESAILVNSTTALVLDPAVYYIKTGDNTATLSCVFGAKVMNGYSYHQYDLQLVFTSPNEGYYSGRYKNDPEETGEATSGYFAFDTEMTPNFDEIDDSKDNPIQGEGGDVDWEEGDDDPSQDVDDEEADVSYDLELEIVKVYPDRFTYQIHYKDPNAYYTETGRSAEVALCYGTEPHPEITDNTTPLKSVDKLSSEFVETLPDDYPNIRLEEGTLYYIRPFKIVDGAPVYYEEYQMATLGKSIQATLDFPRVGDDIISGKIAISYAINQSGTYHVYLYAEDRSPISIYTALDLGYKEEGDKGTYIFTHPSRKKETYYSLIIEDIGTGIVYSTNATTRIGSDYL